MQNDAPFTSLAELRKLPVPPLPDVGTVSLEGLRAPTRIEPPEPTADEVLAAYLEALEDVVPRQPRAEGEATALGDDVELDVLAFEGQALVAFSFRHLWTTRLEPSPDWPGLFEALAGHPVGSTCTIPVKLGERRVEVTVVIHAASPVRLEGPAEAAFALLGLGESFEATLTAICERLARERLDEAERAQVDVVLRQFAGRWSGEVPEALLVAEATQEWIHAEGEPMVEAGLSPALLGQALAQWLQDPPTRERIHAHLQLEFALRALGEQQPPVLTVEGVLELLAPVAQELGFGAEQLASALTGDRETATELTRAAYRLSLVRTVLEHAAGFERP